MTVAAEVPSEPLSVHLVNAATGLVDTENVAVLDPAGIVTVDGNCTEVFGEESPTCEPPGEIADRVTVPVADAPPETLVGVTVILDIL